MQVGCARQTDRWQKYFGAGRELAHELVDTAYDSTKQYPSADPLATG
jgi:hypothetical protein